MNTWLRENSSSFTYSPSTTYGSYSSSTGGGGGYGGDSAFQGIYFNQPSPPTFPCSLLRFAFFLEALCSRLFFVAWFSRCFSSVIDWSVVRAAVVHFFIRTTLHMYVLFLTARLLLGPIVLSAKVQCFGVSCSSQRFLFCMRARPLGSRNRDAS